MEQTLSEIHDLKKGLVEPDKSSNAISKKGKDVTWKRSKSLDGCEVRKLKRSKKQISCNEDVEFDGVL